jgi:hypothetical protein
MHVTLPEIFVLGATGYCIFTGAQASWRIRASRSWPSTTGKIIRSDIVGGWEEGSSGRGWSFSYMYKPDVRYEYFIHGQCLEGSDVSYKTFSASGKSLVADPTIRFPIGLEVEVFYNPKNPNDSMLASARPPFYLLMVPFLFAAALGILFASGVAAKWKFFN